MTKELLIQLKNAGFPIRENGGHTFIPLLHENGEYPSLQVSVTMQGKTWFVPTLSELIEACGENFGGVICLNNGVHKNYKVIENMFMIVKEPSKDFHSFIKGKTAHGSTPEEAVANLWLALNDKQ